MTSDKKKRLAERVLKPKQKPTLGFAKKSLGQNFLVDENYIERIISALSLKPGDTIVEIGPGRGALTERLIDSGAGVIAVEIDDNLAPYLKEKFAERENFSVVHGDALEIDFPSLKEGSLKDSEQLKLVANLPYYISTAILQKLIEQRAVFSQLVLMLQREVVDRITAEVSTSERGFLTVLVEAYMEAEKLFDVPPAAFRPQPRVWSSIVELTPKKSVQVKDGELFRQLIAAGFVYKRKTILNNLKNAPPILKERFGDASVFLEGCEIDPQRRAETLALEEWLRIENALLT